MAFPTDDKGHILLPISQELLYIIVTIGNAVLFMLALMIVLRRNVQPVRARSWRLLLASLVGGMMVYSLAVGHFIWAWHVECYLDLWLHVVSIGMFLGPMFVRTQRTVSLFRRSQERARLLVAAADAKRASLIDFSSKTPLVTDQARERKRASIQNGIITGVVVMLHLALLLGVLAVFPEYANACPNEDGDPNLHIRPAATHIIIDSVVAVYVLALTMLSLARLGDVADEFGISNEIQLTVVMLLLNLILFVLFDQLFPTEWPPPFFLATMVLTTVPINVIYPVYRTYVNPPKVEFKDSSVLSDFDSVLKPGPAYDAFSEFLIGEFSPELLLFKSDVDTFRESFDRKSPEQNAAAAKYLLEQYILPGSAFQVNVADTTVRTCKESIEASDEVTKDIFDQVYDEVYDLLKLDSYPRFLHSRACIKLKAQIDSQTVEKIYLEAADLA